MIRSASHTCQHASLTFHQKTDKDAPRWYMVDVKFVSRAAHFISLSLLRYVADLPSSELPEEMAYVGSNGVEIIKGLCQPLDPVWGVLRRALRRNVAAEQGSPKHTESI